MTGEFQKGFLVSRFRRIDSRRHRFDIICILLAYVGVLLAPAAAAQEVVERLSGSSLRADTLQAIPQEAPAELTFLEKAFARGDASEMMKYSAKHLDITLFSSNELYSRSQAGYVLKAFFKEYSPEKLSLTEVSGSEANWFAAGSYWYGTGESQLTVYFRLRRGEFGWELREIRIGRISDR